MSALADIHQLYSVTLGHAASARNTHQYNDSYISVYMTLLSVWYCKERACSLDYDIACWVYIWQQQKWLCHDKYEDSVRRFPIVEAHYRKWTHSHRSSLGLEIINVSERMFQAAAGGIAMFSHEISIVNICRVRVWIHRAKQNLFVILTHPKSERNLRACEQPFKVTGMQVFQNSAAHFYYVRRRGAYFYDTVVHQSRFVCVLWIPWQRTDLVWVMTHWVKF